MNNETTTPLLDHLTQVVDRAVFLFSSTSDSHTGKDKSIPELAEAIRKLTR